MKSKLKILLIIFVTLGCIYLGFQTRKNKAINVTGIQTTKNSSLSYMLKTDKNNIVMIDGGSYEDSEYLENILLSNGGIVESWYITLAHSENFGALQRILENGKIQINHIYISFNSLEWYSIYEPERYDEISEFFDLIYSSEYSTVLGDVPNKFESIIDNLYITVLNIKNPELIDEYAGFNQSMVIKVSNTYKSIIFMGNIANEAAKKFKDNNLDEIDCDVVQISNNLTVNAQDEIYKLMTPENILKEENYDTTMKIW